jgi:uncharacterized protein
MPETARVLIAGITTRAMAISAARAGYRVTAVDAFGDMDLRAEADVVTLSSSGLPYAPTRAALAAGRISADYAAYTSNFENYPRAVSLLGHGRQLLGNSAEVLNRVRNPIELMKAVRTQGFPVPETRATIPRSGTRRRVWLVKPRRSGGGHSIRVWHAGVPVSRSSYLQERISGTPGSIVFAADGKQSVPLGLSRQLVGDSRLGAHGFRYCGSLLGGGKARLFAEADELLARAAALAAYVTSEFGLVGLNGLDFIAHDGVPYPIEVNPRYSASMELVERLHGFSMFEIHLRACRGSLPAAPPSISAVEGKAIVFARRNVRVGKTLAWMNPARFADVPHPGEPIGRGHPICTVFATANSARACHHLLLQRSAAVHRETELRRGRAA